MELGRKLEQAPLASFAGPISLRTDLRRQSLVSSVLCPASAKPRRPRLGVAGPRWSVLWANTCLWVFAQAFLLGAAHGLPPAPASKPVQTPANSIRGSEQTPAVCQVSDLLLLASAPSKAVADCRRKWGFRGLIAMSALLLVGLTQGLESIHKLMRWLWVGGRRGWRWLCGRCCYLRCGQSRGNGRPSSPTIASDSILTPHPHPALAPAKPPPRTRSPLGQVLDRQPALPSTAVAQAAMQRALSCENPFGDRGCIRDPARFFNRERELAEIFDELRKGSSLSLIGEAQVGKSSLLAMIVALGPQVLERDAAQFVTIDMQVIRNEDEFFDALCEKLGLGLTVRGLALDRALRGRRVVVALDEIEKMANPRCFSGEERAELRGHANGPDTPLTLVIASRSSLDKVFDDDPGRTSPLAGICGVSRVLPFSQATSRDFLLHRLQGNAVAFTANQLQWLHEQSGGHPGQLQAIAAELYRRLALS